MDFWDLLKTLWRRVWVTVPLLALTAVVGGYVWSQAQPDFRATGHVSLVAPTARDTAGVNPWDTETMAGILVVRLQDNVEIERTLQSEGFSGSYVASVETSRDQPLPIVKIEVTAHTPETARATVVRLIDLAAAAVTALQLPANLQPNEMITMAVLSSGDNVVEVNTTTIRAVIVVVLAGLILTVGAAIGVDAAVRTRAARRNDDDLGAPLAPRHRRPEPEPPRPPMPQPGRSPLADVRADGARSRPRPGPGAVAASDSTVRVPGGIQRVPGKRAPALSRGTPAADGDRPAAPLDVDDGEQWFDLTDRPTAPVGPAAPTASTAPTASARGRGPMNRGPERDSTIVLPLSNGARGARIVDAVEPADDPPADAPERPQR